MPDGEDDIEAYPYLRSLNPAQLRAVTAPPSRPLQILAGPGSGKTRVLTSRVAHLVKCHRYSPRSITAVTFTNKAAAEMRKRLNVLLGPVEANQLVLGTFHATCAKYLRRYGSKIGLNNNFSIADADDCKKIMARLLKDRKEALAKAHLNLKEGAVLSEISKAKAKGETSRDMAARAAKASAAGARSTVNTTTNPLEVIAELYAEYEAALVEADALDFDDLLLYGLKLFTKNPDILKSCRHILVDEFQDTNTTQYELMRCFAAENGGVSIVGDPDQSIYGWRSAEVENLGHMMEDFDNVDVICLEENYRSTGAILAASHSIVSQDSARIKKSLYTSHPQSTPVMLKLFAEPDIEADFIANEIKRMVAYSGDMLNYDDFAILLRYNALSRQIESALQREGVPSRVIGGHKFFERMEIKDLLAYLQLADNPNFTPAFMRVVNVPKRRLGDTSVSKIVEAAKKARVSPMELCESIVDGAPLSGGITNAVKRDLGPFVGVVRKLRRAALKGMPVRDLIPLIVKETKYDDHLRNHEDFEQRWENVQELINYSVMVSQDRDRQAESDLDDTIGFAPAKNLLGEKAEPSARLHPMFKQRGSTSSRSTSVDPERRGNKRPRVKVENDVIEILSSEDEAEPPDVSDDSVASSELSDGLNPLRFFLQSSMLSTDTDNSDEGVPVPKVTISTVHAAKGLEWPAVFIPAVEQGTFPAARCIEDKEIAEERRLLYVAMTRAQSFLTLTHTGTRMVSGDYQERMVSEFVHKSCREDPHAFSEIPPTIDETVRRQMSKILSRPAVDEEATKDLIAKYLRTAPSMSSWDKPARRPDRHGFGFGFGSRQTRFDYWATDTDEGGAGSRPGFMAFSSAKSFMAPQVPKPPVQKLVSSNRNLPPPLPFSFGGETAQAGGASLASFTSGSNSSLAAMKLLGLPETPPTGNIGTMSKTANNSGPSAETAGVGVSRGSALSEPVGDVPGTETDASGQPVLLARGTKRLGMRRSLTPWKRNKME